MLRLFSLALAGSSVLAMESLAQSQLRVIRRTPADSATPGSVVTITFDRPVAGSLDSSIDARRVMRIEPAVPGVISWRDPVTLRFVAVSPLEPGSAITVTVDTNFAALDGSRLAQQYRFIVRVPGPTPLGYRTGTPVQEPGVLGVRPSLAILYSAPVNLDSVRAASQLEFDPACPVRTVPVRPTTQRTVQRNERFEEMAGGERDTTADRFRRVVELTTDADLPDNCVGLWLVPSFDPARPGDVWRYRVRTPPPFVLRRPDCPPAPRCEPPYPRVAFSARVSEDQLRRFVRLTPSVPSTIDAPPSRYGPSSYVIKVEKPFAAGTVYSVAVDSSISDIYGRKLRINAARADTIGNYGASVTQPAGLRTLARSALSLDIEYINFDTVAVTIFPIPERFRARLLTIPMNSRRAFHAETLSRELRDSLFFSVATNATLDESGRMRMPFPTDIAGKMSSGLYSLRVHGRSATLASPIFRQAAGSAWQNVPVGSSMGAWDQPLGLLLQVSEFAAHTKLAGDSGAVFLTHVNGSGPVAGASISLRDGNHLILARGVSNADGLAMLSPTGDRPALSPIVRDSVLVATRYLEVQRGDERSAFVVEGSLANTYQFAHLAREPVAKANASPLYSTIFTDRDIYRPGEKIFAKVVARYGTLGALEVPAVDSIRWYIVGAGETAADTLWRSTSLLSAFGTSADSAILPSGARLGKYAVKGAIRSGTKWLSVPDAYFTIAEYRAPEFRVRIPQDTAVFVAGDSASVNVVADYLFGGPMVGAEVKWTARLFPASGWGKAPGADGYNVGVPSWYQNPMQNTEQLTGTAVTDASGVATLRIPVAHRSMSGRATLQLTLAVSDANNQSVTASREIKLPAPQYFIAARVAGPGSFWRVGERRAVEFLTVSPDGNRLSGIPVRMTVVSRRWEPDTTAGAYPGARVQRRDTVAIARAVSDAVPVQLSFVPRTIGTIDFLLDARDASGREASTAVLFNYSDTAPPRPVVANPTSPLAFALVADTAVLSAGAVATVRLQSPFPLADAWVTREREGVLQQRRITVREGETLLRETISEQDAPNIWIGVTLVRRGSGLAPGADSVQNAVHYGYVNLKVDTISKMLRVAVTPEDSIYAPGDSATLTFTVREVSTSGREGGVRSEVGVWAVDEGVLSLTGFEFHGLLSRLYAAADLAATLRSQFAPAAWRIGFGACLCLMGQVSTISVGGAGGRPAGAKATGNEWQSEQLLASVRRDFRSTAFFVGSTVTDDSGRAVVKVKVPDNLTTFRIMAVAVTAGDRYGSGESSFTVTRDLVLRPALPRFVRFGDAFVAGAAVNTRPGVANPGSLRIGAAIDVGRLTGMAVDTFSISQGKTRIARFPVQIPAATASDVTRVSFAGIGTGISDAVEVALPIRPDGAMRSHTIVGTVSDSVQSNIMLPGNIDPNRSTVSISFGASPITAIRSNYERIRDYPYRTSDVIAGGGSALLGLVHAQRALGVSVDGLDSTNVRGDLQRAADELSQREKLGWIWLWPLSVLHNHTSPWLSASAATFLLNARRSGVEVRQSLFDAVNRTLLAFARDSSLSRADTITGSPAQRHSRVRALLGGRVAAARYLRHAGVPDTLVERQLLSAAHLMAWEDRVVLAELVGLRSNGVLRARAMLDSLWAATSIVGGRVELPDSLRGAGEFISHIRPAARLLTATLRANPAHPQIGALVQSVMQQGKAEQDWAWNTQDFAAAAVSLSDFAVAQSGTRGAATRGVVLRAAGRELFARNVGSASSDTSATLAGLLDARGDSSLLNLSLSAIGSRASTPIYYAITVNEIPLTRPVNPDIKGIVVERWFESFTNGRPVSEVSEGDLVRVRLQVTVPADRQFVALEDMLPAGLEAVDLSLRTSSSLGPFVKRDSAVARADTSMQNNGPFWQRALYGSWDSGWWQPWEYKELRDDHVVYFARQLFSGTYTATYVARATTPGTFVLPPAHAEEMYNRAVQGRSSGGLLIVKERN